MQYYDALGKDSNKLGDIVGELDTDQKIKKAIDNALNEYERYTRSRSTNEQIEKAVKDYLLPLYYELKALLFILINREQVPAAAIKILRDNTATLLDTEITKQKKLYNVIYEFEQAVDGKKS